VLVDSPASLLGGPSSRSSSGAVSRGILLCTFHHPVVHNRGIHIDRHHGRWRFTDRNGHQITGDVDHRLLARPA